MSSDESENLKRVLLETANLDLRASKCLYKNDYYSQAVFYLEQSVEKTTKSFGLQRDIIERNELKRIGHEGTEIYVKIIDYFQDVSISRFRRVLETYPGIKETEFVKKYADTDIKKIEQKMNDFRDYLEGEESIVSDNILDIPEKEIEVLLTFIENIENEFKNFEIEKKELNSFKEKVTEFAMTLTDEAGIEETGELEKTLENSFDQMLTPKYLKQQIIEIVTLVKLMFLSKILCPHTTPPRYPNGEGFNPIDFYSEDKAIVKKFNQLANIQQEILKELSELFENSSSLEIENNLVEKESTEK